MFCFLSHLQIYKVSLILIYYIYCLNRLKDINDLDGIHGDTRGQAAVTFILDDHHEQVTAGNLLYDKCAEWETKQK